MESIEVRKALDYLPGDVVQIEDESFRDMLGTVIGTKLSYKKLYLLYQICFVGSDGRTIIKLAKPDQMRFLSHANE